MQLRTKIWRSKDTDLKSLETVAMTAWDGETPCITAAVGSLVGSMVVPGCLTLHVWSTLGLRRTFESLFRSRSRSRRLRFGGVRAAATEWILSANGSRGLRRGPRTAKPQTDPCILDPFTFQGYPTPTPQPPTTLPSRSFPMGARWTSRKMRDFGS